MPRITEGQYALGALTAFAVWIFVILPLLYYPRQEAPQYPQRASDSQQQAESIRNEPPTPVALKLFTSAGRNEIAAYCAADANGKRNDWTRKYICDVKITDAYIALFNGLLVIVTVGLILVGSLTIWKMRDTEERQLRAYVFAEPGSLQQGLGFTSGVGIVHQNVPRWRFDVKFKNTGQTPAYGFTQFTTAAILNEPASENDFIIRPEAPISKAPLPAAGEVSTSETMDLTAAEVAAIRAGGMSFYVFGEINYTDAFRRKRKTRFRFIHSHHNAPGDLVYTETGNEEI